MRATPLAAWDGAEVGALQRGWGAPVLEAYGCIPSTNDRARVLAARGCAPFSVVVADEQSEGRGRRGRPWDAAPGEALLMSVTLPWTSEPAPHLPLLVGLAVAEGIEDAAAGVRIGLKWPNDLWLEGGKVGGVLVEAAGAALVAGVGLNVTRAPPAHPGATSLASHGSAKGLARNELAGAIYRSIEARCRGVGAEMDEADVAGIEARDVLRGRAVVCEHGGPGTAEGVGRDGALLLRTAADEVRRVVAGSVRIR